MSIKTNDSSAIFNLFYHDYFFEKSCVDGFNNKNRIEAIYQYLIKKIPYMRKTQITPDSGEAALIIHTPEYVNFILEGSNMEDEFLFPRFPVIARKEMLFSEPKTFLAKHSTFFFDSITIADRNNCRNALIGAKGAKESSEWILNNISGTAYLLSRIPGHHAFKGFGGGLSFFNNGAIAAAILKKRGKVAILDLDQEHGNGTQSIFYEDPDVLTVSIHSTEWPLISGFSDEKGGAMTNVNIQLPPGTKGDIYIKSLDRAISIIKEFQPSFLVLALGFDIHKNDSLPWIMLESEDISQIAHRLIALGLPTVIIQEGGYNPLSNVTSCRAFFKTWLNL